jgi:membrane protein implicated in regulation of membrane protease activity
MRSPPRLLVFFTAAVLVLVLVIAALSADTFWLLPVAFVILIAAAVVVLWPVGKALGQGEKPDPVTDARLEDEGAGSRMGLQGADEPDEAQRGRTG